MDVDAEKLIVLIEKRRPIFDYTVKEHHMKDVIDRLWAEVAEEINATVADCRGKWNTLRSSYSRFLREQRRMPSGSAACKKKKWYLADSMSFLKDFVGQHKKTASNVYVPEELDEEEDTDSLNTSSYGQSILSPSPAPADMIPKAKKGKPSAAELVAGPMVEFLKARTEPPVVSATMKFFESIEPDVVKMSDSRQRKFKHEVLSLLNKYMDEEEKEGQYSALF